VEAAGVEPDIGVENAQLIDSGNARIGMNTKIAKSTVRSLYGDFPELPELPNSTFGRPSFGENSILKCASSVLNSEPSRRQPIWKGDVHRKPILMARFRN
jgi:hypothetical protein